MNSLEEKVDHKAYQLAKAYLPTLNIPGVTEELIEKYLNPVGQKPNTKIELYKRILTSAQNSNMKSGVIGRSIGGVDKLSSVLYKFNSKKVLDEYRNSKEVLNVIIKILKPTGKIRRKPGSLWPKYCETILSAARFIEQFSSIDDFFEWLDSFNRDERSRASLPMLLSREIRGLGFALSCDFIKEMGYVNFPKPDIHLRHIFTALKLFDAKHYKDRDYGLLKAIVRLSNNANVTAYNADKVFWLIGSGYFYNDPQIGKKGRIGSQKQDFIKYALPILSKLK